MDALGFAIGSALGESELQQRRNSRATFNRSTNWNNPAFRTDAGAEALRAQQDANRAAAQSRSMGLVTLDDLLMSRAQPPAAANEPMAPVAAPVAQPAVAPALEDTLAFETGGTQAQMRGPLEMSQRPAVAIMHQPAAMPALAMPQMPGWMTERPQASAPVDTRSLTRGYGTPGSGVMANDYSLSLGRGNRQDVNRFAGLQQQDNVRQFQANEGAANRGKEMANAFFEHIITPFLTASGNIGAQQAAAQGRRDVATIQGQTQRDVAGQNNTAAIQQEMIRNTPALAKVLGFGQQDDLLGSVPQGAKGIMRSGRVIDNPAPAPQIIPLENGGYATTDGARVTMPRAANPLLDPSVNAQPQGAQQQAVDSLKPPKAGARIDAKTRDAYLKAHGGDKDKARQAARADGWDLTLQ